MQLVVMEILALMMVSFSPQVVQKVKNINANDIRLKEFDKRDQCSFKFG